MHGIATAALLLAPLALAQPAGGLQGRISGTVTDAAGAPVPAMIVTILTDEAAFLANVSIGYRPYVGRAGTDASGRFTFESVPPGLYQVFVEAQGFLPGAYGGRVGAPRGTSISLSGAESIEHVDIRLFPAGAISGRVTQPPPVESEEPEARPVSSARVFALSWIYAEGERRLQAQGEFGTTDQEGVFHITGLAPGEYYVYVEAPFRNLAASADALRPTYFPDALTAQTASKVSVFSGFEAVANLRLRRLPLHTIRGAVLDPTGRPASGARVYLLPDAVTPVLNSRGTNQNGLPAVVPPATPFVAEVTTGEDGAFTFPLTPSGEYTVAVVAGQANLGFGQSLYFRTGLKSLPGLDGASGSTPVRLSDSDVEDASIILRPAAEVTLDLQVENSSFAQLLASQMKKVGATLPPNLQANILSRIPQVSLSSPDGFAVGGMFPASAREVNRQQVGPARFFVGFAGLPTGHYVKSIRLSGVDFSRRPVETIGSSAELEIVLASDPGEIRGKVVDRQGGAVAGTEIAIWPVTRDLSKPTGGAMHGSSANDGSFLIGVVPPGEYYVAAFAELPDSGLTTYWPFVSQFSSFAERVTIEPNGSASPSIKPVSPNAISRALAQLP